MNVDTDESFLKLKFSQPRIMQVAKTNVGDW